MPFFKWFVFLLFSVCFSALAFAQNFSMPTTTITGTYVISYSTPADAAYIDELSGNGAWVRLIKVLQLHLRQLK